MKKGINIAVIGFGTIGAGVVKILLNKQDMLRTRSGLPINLKWICDRDFKRNRGIGKVDKSLFLDDYRKAVADKDVDVIVELVGGTNIAKKIVIDSLNNKKAVVTANKALLADYAEDIFRNSYVPLFFEASICGAIPVVKSIRESLIANKIKCFYGIVNGTCNYILSKMLKEKVDFKSALKDAQRLGYAEQDPALDIEGRDSTHKLSLLSLLAFGAHRHPEQIPTQGITELDLPDLLYADEMGYKIKLLAVGKAGNSSCDLRVHPALVKKGHMLAQVDGVFNALYLETDEAGDMMFYGKGAGRFPTAGAVVSDIIDAAQFIEYGALSPIGKIKYNVKLSPVESRYYIRFSVIDAPGVLAKISGVLGGFGISIASVQQKERSDSKNGSVPLILITHEAPEAKMQKAIAKINNLQVNKASPVVIKII